MLRISIVVLLALLSHMLFSQERPKTPSTPTTNIADACSLNFEKLKSAFVQDPAQYKSFNQPEKNNWNRTLRQGVVMKNGTEVRMIKSGCTHYIFLINFRPTEIKAQKAEYLYELATEQLKLMPVEKDEEFNVKLMTNALDKRNWSKIRFENDIYYLPCDGALCTLRVIRENGLPRDLELIYDKTL